MDTKNIVPEESELAAAGADTDAGAVKTLRADGGACALSCAEAACPGSASCAGHQRSGGGQVEAGRSRSRRGLVRGLCIAVVCLVAVGSAIFGGGAGTLSSMGLGAVAYLCPLGALESMFGSFSFVPRLLFALAAVLVVVLLVGRAFCAWVCPVPPLRGFFRTKKAKEAESREIAQAAAESADHYRQGTKPARAGKVGIDSRHVVLCGALGSAAIFGFPVFCLICPIGLTFAIVVGLVRFIGFNEPSLSLVLFAAILVVELVFLRKWCSKICPVSALLSLVSKANRTFRPQADAAKCLRSTQGQSCGACAAVCPEGIDPHSDLGVQPVSECTRCGRCADVCPTAAMRFPFLPKSAASVPAFADEAAGGEAHGHGRTNRTAADEPQVGAVFDEDAEPASV